MKNILEEIYQYKLLEVRNLKKKTHLTEICKKIKCSQGLQTKDFIAAIKNKKPALICEIKKASPSKGVIRENFNPIEIAIEYEKAGAACLSVLTDEKYFMGSAKYLEDVRAVSSLPILRKDFIVDSYQIYESKMLGADCILLIVAMLDDKKLQELEECALSLGLSVLIEVHDANELSRAKKLKSKLIGINNRNLKTFEVDLKTSSNLSNLISSDYLIVAESGINNKDDINFLQKFNINSFLIGEYFMRQQSIYSAVQSLIL